MDARSWHNDAARAGAASPPSDRQSTPSARQPGERLRYPRSCRLVRRSDFEAVYRSGKRRAGPHFAVFGRRNGLDVTRFGSSVSRAIGGAAERNRIRRQVREIVRLHRRGIETGWDIVIQPRRTAARAPYALLTKELVELLRSVTASRS